MYCLRLLAGFVLGVCVGLATTGARTLEAAEPAPPGVSEQFTPLMQMKLEKSKHILEGLALEDYQQIAKNARALKLLSMESGWNVIQTEEYALQSREFRRAVDRIVAAAEAEDVHRATLGYVSLTMRCVECHSYMRRQLPQHGTLPSVPDEGNAAQPSAEQ